MRKITKNMKTSLVRNQAYIYILDDACKFFGYIDKILYIDGTNNYIFRYNSLLI